MMGQEKINQNPTGQGSVAGASGRDAPNPAQLKFPSNVELENFLNSFFWQKERNTMRGEGGAIPSRPPRDGNTGGGVKCLSFMKW
jgi:hypothetical protein